MLLLSAAAYAADDITAGKEVMEKLKPLNEDTVVDESSELRKLPELIRFQEAKYPRELSRRAIQGNVILHLLRRG